MIGFQSCFIVCLLSISSFQIGGAVNGINLFHNVPDIITKETFPITLNASTNSDIILVKCPSKLYIHTGVRNKFFENKTNRNISLFDKTDPTLTWMYVYKNDFAVGKFNCGTIVFFYDQGNISHEKHIEWTFIISWGDTVVNNDIIVNVRAILPILPHIIENCNYHFIIHKGNDSTISQAYHRHINEVVKSTKIYYFERLSITKKSDIIKPCSIIVFHGKCSMLQLSGHNYVYTKRHGIHVLKDNVTSINLTIELSYENFPKYNYNDEFYSWRVQFSKDGIKEIENSNKKKTSKLNFNTFGMANLTYKCLNSGKKVVNRSELVYYGPTGHYKMKPENITYSEYDYLIKPNCSLSYTTIGFLIEIEFGELETVLKKLNISEKSKYLKHSKDFVFIEVSLESSIEVHCIYKTPLGTITTYTNFIVKDTTPLETTITSTEFIVEETTATYTEFIFEETTTVSTTTYTELIVEDTTTVSTNNTHYNHESHSKQNSIVWYRFMKKSFGNVVTYFILSTAILIIIICLLIILHFLQVKLVNYCFKIVIRSIKNPNVYNFWHILKNGSFEVYCNSVKDKIYLSDKLINYKMNKKIEGGEEVDVGFGHLFDESLVNCYKDMKKKFEAHYVYTDSRDIKYILCDGPLNSKKSSFWEMIFNEDIGTVIAIIYNKKSEILKNNYDKFYWTEDYKTSYGDIDVIYKMKIKSDDFPCSGYKFKLEKEGYESKMIDLYHICNWKENNIPMDENYFPNIYKTIIENDCGKNILIHSSQGTGSRVYMLTYFLCMYDGLISRKNLNDPIEVVKAIRENRFGGNIGVYEFAYIIKSLVITLFKNEILINFTNRQLKLFSNYDDFFYNYWKRQDMIDNSLKEFLNFVNILDIGKINEYKYDFYRLGIINKNELEYHCRRFYNVINNKTQKKVLYTDIPCLDSTSITINGKDDSDFKSFIHANEFTYKITDSLIKRKLILCQAPLSETIEDMFDMIIRYNITIVVILANKNEMGNKWIPYFPLTNTSLETKNFSITRIKHKFTSEDFISESEFHLKNKIDDNQMKFTILHYQGWSNKDIPSEHKSIYKLYKKIISYHSYNYIAIHCSAGVGRSGTLALIMYLIDTINIFPTFDPLSRLQFLRQHRYKSVQTFNQFVFALMVVIEHFKKQIDIMDPYLYGDLLSIIYESFKKDE